MELKEKIWISVGIFVVIVLAFVFYGINVQNPIEREEIEGPTDTAQTEEAIAVDSAVLNLRRSGLVESSAEIKTKNIESRDWPDVCLGVPERGRLCVAVITPGYEIILEAEKRDFIYRTDRDGNTVVLVSSQ